MSDAILDRLLQRRTQLRQRMGAVARDLGREHDPLSPDFAEQASQRENDEVLDRIGLSAEAELREIEAAIGRLRSGRYGICEQCGDVIEPARLAAVPYARACVACAVRVTVSRP